MAITLLFLHKVRIDLFGNASRLEIFLILVGIMAIIGVILALFFSFGDSTEYLWASEMHPVGSDEFMSAIGHVSNSPIESGEHIGILLNGDQFLPQLLKTLAEAKKTINFLAYIWEDGKMSDEIFKILFAQAQAGKEVRLLLDGFGGHTAPKDKIEQLKKFGGIVERFRAPKFGTFTRIYRRTHRRAIIIDGEIAFTGGMAVADKWLGNASNPEQWRDTMFELHGCMAQSIQAAFAELWAGAHGEILSGTKFYPCLPLQPEAPIHATYVNLISSPADDTQPLPKFFWLSIASAQKSIYLNSAYVVPSKHIRQALIKRAQAGVDVRLLVPNKYNDAKPVRFASQHYYESYLKAGIKIYEYQPTMIHSKILITDTQWSVIGSANMDIRSVQLNEENVLGINDADFAEELQTIFFEDLKKAKQITLPEFKKRGIGRKILELLFVNFEKQY